MYSYLLSKKFPCVWESEVQQSPTYMNVKRDEMFMEKSDFLYEHKMLPKNYYVPLQGYMLGHLCVLPKAVWKGISQLAC